MNQIFLGSEAWIETMRAIIEEKPRSDEHPKAQRMVGRPGIDKVAGAVAETFEIDLRGLQQARGGAPRMLTAWLGRYESGARLRSIAATLRVGSSGYVSNMITGCERELERDPLLREWLDRCVERLRRVSEAKGRPPAWPAMPWREVIREAPPGYHA